MNFLLQVLLVVFCSCVLWWIWVNSCFISIRSSFILFTIYLSTLRCVICFSFVNQSLSSLLCSFTAPRLLACSQFSGELFRLMLLTLVLLCHILYCVQPVCCLFLPVLFPSVSNPFVHRFCCTKYQVLWCLPASLISVFGSTFLPSTPPLHYV